MSHSLSLLSSFCPDCILLLIGLPFLRSLLRKMLFLPYAFYVVVFCLFLPFLVWFVFLVPVVYLFLFFVSSVPLPGDDALCWLLSCPFLKKNLDASRPSEHPPVRGGNVKTSRWDDRLRRQNLFMAFERVHRW